jgi:hypothetical protein
MLPNNYPTNTYEKNRNQNRIAVTSIRFRLSKSNRIIDYRNITIENVELPLNGKRYSCKFQQNE